MTRLQSTIGKGISVKRMRFVTSFAQRKKKSVKFSASETFKNVPMIDKLELNRFALKRLTKRMNSRLEPKLQRRRQRIALDYRTYTLVDSNNSLISITA